MKTIYLIASLLVLLVTTGACTGKSMGASATGAPGEVIVVMSDIYWKGEAGDVLDDVLKTPVPGLPQQEPALTVSHTDKAHFDGILRVVRNIIVVNIDSTQYTKASMSAVRDEWARNQLVLNINAPTETAFIIFVTQHSGEIVDLFVKEEMKRTQAYLKKNYSKASQDKIREMFGVEIAVPEGMNLSKDTTDFFWTTNNAATGRRDMVVYSFPYTDKNTFTKDYMIAMRDSVMKANVPGGFPNSYMTTEKRFITDYKGIDVNGKYVGELRGLWKMEGDKMGGPFVSHAMLDEKNQRVIVAEGFVYSPETNKRNYMRQLEAALYTMQFPGDKQAADQE